MAKWLIPALLFAVTASALAQQPSCMIPRRDLVRPEVRAVVSPSHGGFNYTYSVTNSNGAQQTLISFAVAAVSTPPVQTSPPNWEAGGRITGSSLFVWDTFVEPAGLPAGTSATGFGFTTETSALPSVVDFLAWGSIELPTLPDGAAPESCANSDIIRNSFRGATVGPRTPPPFVAIESLNRLITLLHDSRRLGWVKRDDVHQSMLTKLSEAKRRFEANDLPGANNSLKAFIAEVAGVSCEDVSCHGNHPSTSAAYALLYFNGKYVSDRLP